MPVHLNACSIHRPQGDRLQPRINLEAEAIVAMLNLIESGDMDLLLMDIVSSGQTEP
uniref:Uncharacterized protein n=1 Tax=Candidatus Kentrum sp. FW TaxID=2126338 RepID=A0A450SFA7_9GAMM|nr:MAG: hypothetical protein BECKFW1821A_GA0114235_103132 [Candidatus Kentron sp. FW]